MKSGKYILRGLVVSGLVLSMLFGAAVWNSRIELTQSGIHKSLLIPLGPLGSARMPMYAGTGDQPVLPGLLDGPIVKSTASGAWTATWFCEDRVERQAGTAAQLVVDCAGKRSSYALAFPAPAASAVLDMPSKLLVLSDIEGNLPFLDAALRELGAMDEAGNWSYGRDRLVIAGDAVDRGREVFGVLWRLYALDIQARRAGGGVHLLLGNHEQYLLRGNPSRAHSEHIYALEQMGGQKQAFGSDTVLGRWLREQPVVMRVGKVVLTHGGISPEVAASGLSVHQLNDAMARYWRNESATPTELDAVLGPAGVSQYRGYLEDGGERYAKASEAEVDAVLRSFDASAIVVGHTLVDRVTSLHGGRVHAIDVNSNSAAPEVLLFEDGVPTVVRTRTRRNLPEKKVARVTRPLNLFAADDWRMLGSFVHRSYELSQLPHPY